MSSTLKYNPVPGLADLYALGAVPRVAVMRRFREYWTARVDAEPVHQSAMDAQLLLVLEKYRDLLPHAAYGEARAKLASRIADNCPAGPAAAIARFKNLDARDR